MDISDGMKTNEIQSVCDTFSDFLWHQSDAYDADVSDRGERFGDDVPVGAFCRGIVSVCGVANEAFISLISKAVGAGVANGPFRGDL